MFRTLPTALLCWLFLFGQLHGQDVFVPRELKAIPVTKPEKEEPLPIRKALPTGESPAARQTVTAQPPKTAARKDLAANPPPAKIQPARTEAAKVAAVKEQRAKPKAEKVQSAKVESVKAPAKKEPPVTRPEKVQSAKIETVKESPPNPHPEKVQAAKAEPIKKPATQEPIVKLHSEKTQTAKIEPAKAPALKEPAATDDSEKAKTAKAEPAKAPALKEPVTNKNSEKVQTAKVEQAKGPAVKELPANPRPEKVQSAKADPVKAPVVKESPVKPQPEKIESARLASAKIPPAQEPTVNVQLSNRSMETASTRLADGFDFPVGKPEAEGYYKARGFRSGGHVGEDWDGIRGGDTDLGDPIYCIGDGVVVFARDVHLGWGNVVIVRHAYRENGEVKHIDSLYGHLNSIAVKRGQKIARGQQLGTMGTAHGQYDAHLHLEIRKNLEIGMSRSKFQKTFSNYYDPSQFIASHRRLSGGGANFRVAMNTFTHDSAYHFDDSPDFSARKRSTAQSSAALKRAISSTTR